MHVHVQQYPYVMYTVAIQLHIYTKYNVHVGQSENSPQPYKLNSYVYVRESKYMYMSSPLESLDLFLEFLSTPEAQKSQGDNH